MRTQPPAKALSEKIGSWLVTTGVLTALITSLFQYEEWVYQNKASLSNQDTQKLLGVEDKLNNVVTPRYFRSKRLFDALVNNVTEKEFNSAEQEFYAIDNEWFDEEPGLLGILNFMWTLLLKSIREIY